VDADAFPSLQGCGFDNGPDDRVQSGAVPAAGDNADFLIFMGGVHKDPDVF
jgi:hypothetical protein